MSRRREAEKRKILSDYQYNNQIVAKFINYLMWDGKKGAAEKIFYEALEIAVNKTKEKDHLKVFNRALNNVKPVLEVKSKRVGGATYQVPVEVNPDRKVALAIRWLVTYARSKKGKSMAQRLSDEFVDAYNNQGSSVKKKEDTHKMAEANRAFAHYKW